MSDINDLISRQKAIDAIANCTNCGNEKTLREYVTKHSLETRWTGGILDALDAVQDLPSAQTDLITKIQNEIKVTDANDVYSCGMRNGMRWCLSLIDGKEPLYESPLSNVAVMMQVILDESRKEQDE